MALRLSTKRSRRSTVAGLFVMTAALVIQPLYTMNPSYVSAVDGSTQVQVRIVNTANQDGWAAVDDNGKGGAMQYVSGPVKTPLGTGSAQLEVTTSNQGYALQKAAYGGTKLTDITTLDYSTYTNSDLVAPTLQLNITPDVTSITSWSGRLVYEPYNNGSVTSNTWQTWHATAGKWWLSKPASFNSMCSQISKCTFAELIEKYPNIGIISGENQGVVFKAGSGWNNFVGNVDAFHIVTSTVNETYNFEADDSVIPTVELTSGGDGTYNPAEYRVHAKDDTTLALVTGNLYRNTTLVKSCSARPVAVSEYTLVCPTSTTLADGVYAIRYNAKDTAGKLSTTKASTFTIDHTKPVVTVKPSSLGTDGQYRNVSFKLSDNLSIDKIVLNGKEKDLSNNKYSDLNSIKPGAYGAVEGVNTLVVYDIAGNATTMTFTLDTIAPTVMFSYNPSNGEVKKGPITVTLKAGEPIQTPDGWTRVDETTYTRLFATNTKGSVPVADPAGNVTTANYEVKRIDTVAPVVSGIRDGTRQTGDVNGFIVSDQNFKSVTVDGAPVACAHGTGYEWHCPAVKGIGEHVVVVADKAQNETTVRFSIDDAATPTNPNDGTTTNPTPGESTTVPRGVSTGPTTDGTTTNTTPIATTGVNTTTFAYRSQGILPVEGASSEYYYPTATSDEGTVTQQNVAEGQVNTKKAADSTNTEKGSVLGASDQKRGCTKLLGICWYWWVPIVIIAAGVMRVIVRPRVRDDETA